MRRRIVRSPSVHIDSQRIWRIRIASDAPRYLLCAAAVAGALASARFAVAPPESRVVEVRKIDPVHADLAAESYALLFARRYLAWNAAEPDQGARALDALSGSAAEYDAGRLLPATGEQRVEWAEVVQAREVKQGDHVYTVAAQTDAAGLLYLTVPIERTAQGRVALSGYPAFVGPPAVGAAVQGEGARVVSDGGLVTVVERALRNYLASAPAELEADLASGARVSVPPQALGLTTVRRVAWTADGRGVLAVVQAQDARGAQYTLAYELDVVQVHGRWEISAVQMDPNS